MTLPRVLLVEDDASIRRFIALALEDEPLELLSASNVADALALLHSTGPVQVLVTDLMMPGASGTDLLDALAAEPRLRGQARVVVLSAGLAPEVRAQLQARQVWSLLHKPVALAELQACVRTALAGAEPSDDAAPASQAQAGDPAPCGAAAALSAAECEAVAQYFGGDAALFLGFRTGCRRQFAQDLQAGRQAVQRGDAPALRRLAHNLKSVLTSLGQPTPAQAAQRLEQACAGQRWAEALHAWPAVEAALVDAQGTDGEAGN